MIVGSGLSAAEGLSGMGPLAEYLTSQAGALPGNEAAAWKKVQAELDASKGLEAALLAHPPPESLEAWIRRTTCELLVPEERAVVAKVLQGGKTLRLSALLPQLLRSGNHLPILTTNYDRLVEVACELVGLHVDTTATGVYAGDFDHARSVAAGCKGLRRSARGVPSSLEYHPRAVVLKPHGSFDWYQGPNGPRRSSLELDAERLIITPGLNKYRAGYDSPFDKHRELANEHIRRAARFLVVGYGFNDAHLQVHLTSRMKAGVPTLILNRSLTHAVEALVKASPTTVCLSSADGSLGTRITTPKSYFTFASLDIWDLAVLVKEILQ